MNSARSACPWRRTPSALAPRVRLRLRLARLLTSGLGGGLGAVLVLTGCSMPGTGDQAAGAAPRLPAAQSWAPDPVARDGLRMVATAGARGLRLHVRKGEVAFLPGVNLGATTPGHQPGELAIDAADYRRWFAQMARLGIRVIRIYTVHPPAFYTELARYNHAHPDAPLYLVQGVYLPDESYVETQDLWEPGFTDAFLAELRDASAAVHGDLRRGLTPGRASGTWTADVSDWVTGWIVGVEWDPAAVLASDQSNAAAPGHHGRYFRSTAEASPTERWLAAAMDELAAAEAGRGDSAPVAFANWPSADPLSHPAEPNPHEDLVGLDANHVRATAAWPGGTFASYHVYPYYPDFLRHEAALRRTRYRGRQDAYAGYLAALRRHHAPMPVVISEFGVPSSLGSAHAGPLGRDQGGHTEQDAMRTDADLMRLIHAQGLSGAFLFSWSDEWFKSTWNTMLHQMPSERRALWHDALTNEQHFGILATDPLGPAGSRPRPILTGDGAVRSVSARTDEAYVHLRVRLSAPLTDALTVGVDTVDGGRVPVTGVGGDASDYAFVLGGGDRTGRAWVRTDLDPTRWNGVGPAPAGEAGWNLQRLVTNRSLRVGGQRLPVEYDEVGVLRHGVLDPTSPAYDNLATWQLRDGGRVVDLRIPWAMAGLADPSSHQATAAGPAPRSVPVERLGVSVGLGGQTWQTQGVTWRSWQAVRYRERVKHGVAPLVRAFRDLAP